MKGWTLTRIERPEDADDPLTVDYIRDQHLRAANGTAEDTYIDSLRKVSLNAAEHRTGRLLLPQTWLLSRDCVPPCLEIELPIAPIQSVDAITYVDVNGAVQTFGGSPSPWTLVNPTVESNRLATIRLAYNQVWPVTRSEPGAFRVMVTVGYPVVNSGSPAVGIVAIPDDIQHGRLLVIGELYKQRSESVHASNQNPAIRGANSLWDNWRVFV